MLKRLGDLCFPVLNRSSKTAQGVSGGISKNVSVINPLLVCVLSRDRFGFKLEVVLVYSRSYTLREKSISYVGNELRDCHAVKVNFVPFVLVA